MNDTTEMVWLFWLDHCARYGGVPPTVRTIRDALGIASTSTVNYHLHKLVEDGRLMRITPNRFAVVGAEWRLP